MSSVKSVVKPIVNEFEKIGSQTASQAAQVVKQVASDVVNETVGSKQTAVSSGNGTNEDQSAQSVQFQQQMTKAKQDDAQKTRSAMAQIRQNLKALMTPKPKPESKPIYYKMWEEMEKKKQEKQEIEYKKHEEAAAVSAAGKSTGEMKKGIGG